MNRRTAESAGGGQNIEVKNIVLFFLKTSAVRNSLFDLPAIASPPGIARLQPRRTGRSGEAGGCSIFKI
jgi:hypothetical protein